MALTLRHDADRAIELDDFVEQLSALDVSEAPGLACGAPLFARLLRNPRVVTDALNAELRTWRTRSPNQFSADGVRIADAPGFRIAANFWRPVGAPDETSARADDFPYDVPHSHGRMFMTGGYLGPGYRTRIYEYEHGDLRGIPGEPVEIGFLEDTTLDHGKIMIYRALKDIHVQIPPPSCSVSIIVLVNNPAHYVKPRLTFDIERSVVERANDAPPEPRMLLCEVAKAVGDGATVDLLEELASSHADPAFRASCMASAAELDPDLGAALQRQSGR